MVRVFVPGLSILKVCLLEALSELTDRLQNTNCLGRPGIESLPLGQGIAVFGYRGLHFLSFKSIIHSCRENFMRLHEALPAIFL